MSDDKQKIAENPYHLQLSEWPDFKFMDNNIEGRIPVCRIESWDAFEKSLMEKFHDVSVGDLIYRGQRRFDWQLAATLTRQFDGGAIPEEISAKLQKKFQLAMRGRGIDISGFETNEAWAYGQHFGLATPLLDWTESPFVALFFAFAEEDDDTEKPNPTRALFCINRERLNDLLPDLFFEPTNGENSRLVNQAGLFTVTPAGEENLVSAILNAIAESGAVPNVDDANDIAKYICKIHIPNDRRAACLSMLRKMNIHHGNLFPDATGASRFCNDWLDRIVIERRRDEEARRKLAESEKKRTPVVQDEIDTPSARLNIGEVLENLIVHDDDIPLTTIQDWATRINAKYSETRSLDWPKHTSTRSNMRVEMKRLLSALGFPRDRRDVAVDKIVTYLEAEYNQKNNLQEAIDGPKPAALAYDALADAQADQTVGKTDSKERPS